jgi:hypothetical protein
VEFTLAEVCEILDPPVTERQLRRIVNALGWQPDGTRRDGRRGRPHSTYRVERILKLHAALMPFLRDL